MTHAHAPEEAERQILTFTLGSQGPEAGDTNAGAYATDYGVDLLDVQEIRGYSTATPIPNTPPYVKGAINLRGAVIPVIDLRIRFGISRLSYTKFTVIIVVMIGGKTIGLVADGVSDVLTLRASQFLPPPGFGAGSGGAECVEGIVNLDGNLVLMLSLRKMLALDGIVVMPETQAAA